MVLDSRPGPNGPASVPDRINVLWVIDHVCWDGNLHGGGRLFWNVLPRFDRQRFNVIPYMLRADDDVREVFADSPEPVHVLDKGKFDLTTAWSLRNLIRKSNIHVMHMHCYAASTFGRMVGRSEGIPTIIHDYDTEVYFPYPWYLGVADRALAGSTFAAMAASPMVRDFLVRKRRIDPDRIRLMFHAVPEERFVAPPDGEVAGARDLARVEPGTTVVGTITKLGPQRGNEHLLEAAARAALGRSDTILLIGYKPTLFHRLPSKKYVSISDAERAKQVAQLEAAAERLGIRDRVRFVEWSTDTAALSELIDVFVAPFESERFSSVNILEAMARGKPVVATRLGEQAEIIADGESGYLVEPGDVAQLASRILALVEQPGLRQKMGLAAAAEAERHSVDACVERLQTLYAEAVRETNGAS